MEILKRMEDRCHMFVFVISKIKWNNNKKLLLL